MLLEFRTKTNANGHYKYLAIDTNAECYSCNNPHIYCDGITIKTKDYRKLLEKLKMLGFTEHEYIAWKADFLRRYTK